MVDNFTKIGHGITFDGYVTPATEEGGLTYSNASSRLLLRDGYGVLHEIAHTDDIYNPLENAEFASPRITLNVTDPSSSPVDNAGMVIKFGESAGDELFGSALFSGSYNPCVLWDQDTQSWFIGTASGEGLRVGSDAYGVTLTPNNADRAAIDADVLITGTFKLPTGAVAGYLLVTDADGNATWQSPGAASATPLQASYNAGNTITISSGIPVIINAPVGPDQTILQINSDMAVTGTLDDPQGISFTPQASSPFGASDAGLYVDLATSDLIYDRPSPLSSVNLIAALTSLSIKYWNNTGSLILKGTPVRINTSGDLALVDVTQLAHAQGVIGVTQENIATGTTGDVATIGNVVSNISTGIALGSIVYIDKNGAISATVPTIGAGSPAFAAGDFQVRIGVITRNPDNPSNKDLSVTLGPIFQL